MPTSVCHHHHHIHNNHSHHDDLPPPLLLPPPPSTQSDSPDGDQVQPLVRKNSSQDRPDLMNPIFSDCYSPLLWASPWIVAYGEFFDNRWAWLDWVFL